MVAVDPVLQAQANLEEAERQLKHAKELFKRGDITQERLDQLSRLRDDAAEDAQRTIREFGAPIPEDEKWSGNFRPA